MDTDEKALFAATEQASRESFKIFEKIVASWKDRERPIGMFDYIVVAKVAVHFLSFGYLTILKSMGQEGADRWLHMALGLVEADVADMSKTEVQLPIMRAGKKLEFPES